MKRHSSFFCSSLSSRAVVVAVVVVPLLLLFLLFFDKLLTRTTTHAFTAVTPPPSFPTRRLEDPFPAPSSSAALAQSPSPSSSSLQDHDTTVTQKYLALHQRTNCRKAWSRAVQIVRIVLSKGSRPLVTSFWEHNRQQLQQTEQQKRRDWDAFWTQTTKITTTTTTFNKKQGTDVTTNSSSKTTISTLDNPTVMHNPNNSNNINNNNMNWTHAERAVLGLLPALGPMYVKLGQAVATRPDLVHSVPLATALSSLHEADTRLLAPIDDVTAKRIIRRELLSCTGLLLNRKTSTKTKRKPRRKVSTAAVSNYNSSNTIAQIDKDTDNHEYPYLRTMEDLERFLDSLSEHPVAAASIAQVYKGNLPGFGPVAVKVQRPGVVRQAERDTTLFHTLATLLERIHWKGLPLAGNINVVHAVDEFTARVLEELDFNKEVRNCQVFYNLYDYRHQQQQQHQQQSSSNNNNIPVVVPHVIPELCTRRIIVMEWLEGKKLTDISEDDSSADERKENLRLVKQAIECTLAQLLDTGVLHADPHTGNLLKVKVPATKFATNKRNNSCKQQVVTALGYLDFGLVNYVPQKFRDAIVCAVVQIVFARNIEAVADLLVDVGLLSSEESYHIPGSAQRKKLLAALSYALENILTWPTNNSDSIKNNRSNNASSNYQKFRKRRRTKNTGLTAIPQVRFQNLFACLAVMIANFDVTVPPYFLNNARALATLEGIALRLDPNFNILRVIYPYSIHHLMRNPQVSHKAQETFLEICRNPQTRLVDWGRFNVLLNDWALLTGHRKRRIFWDLLTSRGGRLVSARIVQEWYLKRVRQVKGIVQHVLDWDIMPSWDVFWQMQQQQQQQRQSTAMASMV